MEERILNIDKADWVITKLGDLAEEISIRVDNPAKSVYKRFVGLEHFISGDLKIKNWSSTENISSSAKAFKTGDILFARRNAYLRRASLVEFDGCCSGDAIVIREDNNKVVPGFLALLMNSNALWDYANSNAAGTMSKRVKWRDLAEYEFLLPPKKQQAQLADLLWTMHDVIERGCYVEKKKAALYDSFLDEVIKDLKDKYSLKQLESIVDKSRPITYGILKPGTGYIGGIPVIKVRDYPNGSILKEGLLLTSPEIEAPYKRSRLQKGDLLLSIRGTVGRIAEVPEFLDGANITQDTARLAIIGSVNHLYVRTILESKFIQRQIKINTTGLAVQGINLGEVRKLMLPIPDISTQNFVALKLKCFQDAFDKVKSKISNSKALQKSLINQIF